MNGVGLIFQLTCLGVGYMVFVCTIAILLTDSNSQNAPFMGYDFTTTARIIMLKCYLGKMVLARNN